MSWVTEMVNRNRNQIGRRCGTDPEFRVQYQQLLRDFPALKDNVEYWTDAELIELFRGDLFTIEGQRSIACYKEGA